MLSFVEVSPANQDVLEQWRVVVNEVGQHDMPGLPSLTPRMAQMWHKHPRHGFAVENYLAVEDGEPVGRLGMDLPQLDNLSNVYFSLEVRPAQRRRGIGSRLYELLLERVKAAGRTTIMGNTAWELPGIEVHDGGAGPAFAEAMGLDCANLAEVIRRLELSKLDDAAIDAMYEKAQAASAGYRLVQWGNRAPDELVDGIAYLDGRLIQDAPMGDLAVEPEKVDATRVRAIEEAQIKRGRKSHNTGVIHSDSGRLVAWTCISTDPELDWHAWQNITIVDPDHRGHRLGALVKVANLRSVRQAVPSLRAIDTGNAAVNSYMISINEQMGFQPMWAFQNWQRDL